MWGIPIEDVKKREYDLFGAERAVLILSGDIEKKSNIMTASWFMKAGIDPDILWAVSIGKDRYTQELIREYGEFVIAFPKNDNLDILYRAGSCHGDEVDKIKEFGLKTVKGSVVKAPLLIGCKANLEMVVKYFKDNGSHYMFVGIVVEAWEE